MNILEEAGNVCNGQRQQDYSPPEDNFKFIGIKWAATLDAHKWTPGTPIPPRIVALMMIDLKTCRDAFAAKKDNLVDIAGYAYCGSRFEDYGE